MAYSASSPLLGSGAVSAAQIDAFVRKCGRQLAPAYAPDHTYQEPPAVGASIVAYCDQWHINSDLAAAQFIHESAGGQSAIFRAKSNPAGLGAVNDNPMGGAITFASADEGIRAQIAHLADYAAGRGDWTQYDPRAAAMPAASFGIATSLSGLDGRWAVPGVGYGAAIAQLANELVQSAVQSSVQSSTQQVQNADSGAVSGATNPAPSNSHQITGGNSMATNPTPADIGYPVTVLPAQYTGPDRAISSLLWFVMHDTEGGSWPGDATYLAHPGSSVESAHAVIGPQGDLYSEVQIGTTAWTPGNDAVAEKSVNVELSGRASTGYTDAQYRSAAAFFRWCVAQGAPIPAAYTGRSGAPGIIGHQDVPNPNQAGAFGGVSGHTDPGPLFKWDYFVSLCTAAQAPSAPNERHFDAVPFSIHDGFKAFWESLETKNLALLVLGYPQSNELQVLLPQGSYTMQLFERGALIYEPQNASPWDVHLATLEQVLILRSFIAAQQALEATQATVGQVAS